MKKQILTQCGIAAIALAATAALPTTVHAEVELFAVDLLPTPVANTRFESGRIGGPVVNRAGHVAFNFGLNGAVGGDATWLMREGKLELLGGPDVPERVIDFAPSWPSFRSDEISIGESIVILYTTNGGREGLWALDYAAKSATAIAIVGEASPAGGTYTAIKSGWDANAIGVIGFIGSTAAGDHLIYYNGSSYTVILSSGDQAPGSGGNAIEYIDSVAVNEGNDVLVTAYGQDIGGLWVNRTGALEVVAVANGTIAEGEFAGVIGPIAFSDAGSVAFGASVYKDDVGDSYEALFLDQNGARTKQIELWQTQIEGALVQSLHEIVFTANDDFAVTGLVDHGGLADALIVKSGDGLSILALEGTVGPSGGILGELTQLAGNDQGRVAFNTTIDAVEPSSAVVWSDENGALSVLAMQGEAIDDTTGVERTVGLVNLGYPRDSFNRDGILCPHITLDGESLRALACTDISGPTAHQLGIQDFSSVSGERSDSKAYDLWIAARLTATTIVPTWSVRATFSQPVQGREIAVYDRELSKKEDLTCRFELDAEGLATGFECSQDAIAGPLGPMDEWPIVMLADVGPDGYTNQKLTIDWTASGADQNGQPATAAPDGKVLEVSVADLEIEVDNESPVRLIITNNGPDPTAPLITLSALPDSGLECVLTPAEVFECLPGALMPDETRTVEFLVSRIEANVKDASLVDAAKDPDLENNEVTVTGQGGGCGSDGRCSVGGSGSGTALGLLALIATFVRRRR